MNTAGEYVPTSSPLRSESVAAAAAAATGWRGRGGAGVRAGGVVDPAAAIRPAGNSNTPSDPSLNINPNSNLQPGTSYSPAVARAGTVRSSSSPPQDGSSKRTRLSKDLERTHICPHAGCDKKFSRAEHLSRHELNHTAKQIFRCDKPGCDRAFVRRDLLTRHDKRHRMSKTGNVRTTRQRYDLPITQQPEPNRRSSAQIAQELAQRKDSTVDFQTSSYTHQPNLGSPAGQIEGDVPSSMRHSHSPAKMQSFRASDQSMGHYQPGFPGAVRSSGMAQYAMHNRAQHSPMTSVDSATFGMSPSHFGQVGPSEVSSRPVTATVESTFSGNDMYTPQSEHRRNSTAFSPLYHQSQMAHYMSPAAGSASTSQYNPSFDAMFRTPAGAAYPSRVETPTALSSNTGPAIASNLEQQAQKFVPSMPDPEAQPQQQPTSSAIVGGLYADFSGGLGIDSSNFGTTPAFDMNVDYSSVQGMRADVVGPQYLPYEQLGANTQQREQSDPRVFPIQQQQQQQQRQHPRPQPQQYQHVNPQSSYPQQQQQFASPQRRRTQAQLPAQILPQHQHQVHYPGQPAQPQQPPQVQAMHRHHHHHHQQQQQQQQAHHPQQQQAPQHHHAGHQQLGYGAPSDDPQQRPQHPQQQQRLHHMSQASGGAAPPLLPFEIADDSKRRESLHE